MYLVIVGTVVLLPLALYAMFLSFLNLRRHPTALPGPWDFAGVLLGLSGFIGVAGPLVLINFSHQLYWRSIHRLADVKPQLARLMVAPGSSALFLAYFLAVLAGCAGLIWLRRRVVSVYNTTPDQFAEVFAAALARLGLPWKQVGNRFVIEDSRPAGATGIGEPLILHADPFPLLNHLTLRWAGGDNPVLLGDVEAEIQRALPTVVSPPNPAATWLATGALTLLTLEVFGLALLIFAEVSSQLSRF